LPGENNHSSFASLPVRACGRVGDRAQTSALGVLRGRGVLGWRIRYVLHGPGGPMVHSCPSGSGLQGSRTGLSVRYDVCTGPAGSFGFSKRSRRRRLSFGRSSQGGGGWRSDLKPMFAEFVMGGKRLQKSGRRLDSIQQTNKYRDHGGHGNSFTGWTPARSTAFSRTADGPAFLNMGKKKKSPATAREGGEKIALDQVGMGRSFRLLAGPRRGPAFLFVSRDRYSARKTSTN